MKRISQKGFAPVELVLVVVVLAALAFAGYKVYSANQDSNLDTASSGAPQTSSITGVPKTVPNVKKASDLDSAQKTLDQTDPDASSSDLSSLETQLATF